MIRFATIGTNFIVDSFLESAASLDELSYAAVYSRNQETADRFADKYQAERTCTDLQELANAPDIDAVYIASPNSLHCEQASLFLSHGKHVLCEKPITSNVREMEHLINLSKAHHVVLMEGMRSVFTPGYQVLCDNLSRLGLIRKVSFQYCKYSSRYDNFKSGIIENTFNPAFSNGALMDLGVYCVYPLVRLFGMPKEIKSHALLLHNGIDGAGTILAAYETMQAELVYSKISNSYVPSQIQGEAGTITVKGIGNPSEVTFYDLKGNSQILYQTPAAPDMAGEIKEWVRLIREGSADHPHNQYSLMTLRVMDEARRQMGIVFPADSAG